MTQKIREIAQNLSVSTYRAHAGVAPEPYDDDGTKSEVRYHKYYQWVCFTLFFQAILFYIPRYMWKTWEGKTNNLKRKKKVTNSLLFFSWNNQDVNSRNECTNFGTRCKER